MEPQKWIPAKKTLRRLKYLAVENFELLTGQRDPLTPPKRLHFKDLGDFAAIGNEFFGYFVNLGGLQPWERVLDVGCAVGRMAVPLTRFLDENGGYDGFDIVKIGVDWCNRNIHKRYKNFRFYHADILNQFYNPDGKYLSREYSFPFPDSTFDFVFLTSVFTHMLADDAERYIAEIGRVLKPGGRGLLTFFLINDESTALFTDGKAGPFFRNFAKFEPCTYIANPQMPEQAIGFDEDWVRRRLTAHGLSIAEPIHYGGWCGRQSHLSYQDIVIINK